MTAAHDDPRRSAVVAAVIALSLAHVGLGAAQIPHHAPAMDEGLHLVSGHMMWQSGQSVDPTHPPLARYLLALPAVLFGAEPQPPHSVPAGSRHDDIQHYLVHNRQPLSVVLGAPRILSVLLSLALALSAWSWARRLWGQGGGLVTLALLAFSPLLLAEAPVGGNDVACALTALLAIRAFGDHLQRPSRRTLAWAAVAFFAAQATKFSNVLLLPIFVALYLGKRWLERRGSSPATAPAPLRLLRDTLTGGVAVTLLLWACYGFEVLSVAQDPQIASHVRSAEIRAQVAERVPGWLMELPVPLYSFWKGLAVQAFHAGNQATWTAGYNHQFLFGDNSPDGWWYYFPLAMSVKTPLPFMLIGVAVLVLGWRRRLRRRRAVATVQPPEARLIADTFQLVLPILPAVLWLGFCMLLTINIGIRYVLPVYPLLAVALGAAWPLLRGERHWRPAVAGLLALLLWQAVGTVRAAPHVHAHFNELAGGTRGGWRFLNNSSIDWGQDLPALAHYLEQQRIEDPYLDYFGAAEPADWGLQRYRTLPTDARALERVTGVIVVSQTHLTARGPREPLYSRLRQLRPLAQVGGTLFVYRL